MANSTYSLPTRSRSAKSPPQAVPDDWDADDSESENEGAGSAGVPVDEQHDSAKIWQEANAKAPMPELIIAPSSTGQGAFAPPSAAFQPALRILKRPSASSSLSRLSGSGTVSPNGSQLRGTLAEREAQYQEARNRIFGASSPSSPVDQAEVEQCQGLSDDPSPQPRESVVRVIRNPLGPPPESSSTQKSQQKGFCEKRRGKNGQSDRVQSSET